MTNGSSFLGYDIMQPNNTTEWGSGAGQTLAVTATGTTQTFTSNGKVPAQQNVTVGAYSDTVTATVNF
jgi:spore coat protein U-like protein